MIKHYGVWHPDLGWFWIDNRALFYTTHRCIAQAQLDIARRIDALSQGVGVDNSLYEVRQIEAWAGEEKQDE